MKRNLALYLLASAVQAQTLTTLASFNGTNGYGPVAPLVQGTDGNFYGTTGGATDGSGATVFKITPAGAFTSLYTFPTYVNSLSASLGAQGLVQGSDGNFYGTTLNGTNAMDHRGTVFKITPTGTLTILTNFEQSPFPAYPSGGVIQATDGNFYGTTNAGGAANQGTVFKLTPDGVLTVIYSFIENNPIGGPNPNGAEPVAGLVQATDGNFYGMAAAGGQFGVGTVFKITPAGVLTLLHTFGSSSTDGELPQDGLIQAKDGNLYGTTRTSGTGKGWIFEITPEGVLTPIYIFGSAPPDGEGPAGNLLQAADGNFYGTTGTGGTGGCRDTLNDVTGCGTIFRVTPSGTETILYNFGANPNDGQYPDAGLIQDADGNFYGTTSAGGAGGDGTVFKFSLALPDTPAIASSGGVLNGASYQPGISPGSWITIYGTNLSSATDTWVNAIVKGALPTTLDGVGVMVGGQAAYIEYVSPTQIDAVVPNVAAGSVPVTVTTANGTSQAVMAQLSAEQPAFFQWGTYAVATRQNFSLAVKNGTFPGTTTVPAAPGDVIILWGTGFGPTSPAAPAGQETPSNTTYNTANTVSVTVGGKPATVYGAALAPGYAGLYQVAIQIPASLANGDYPVVATINGAQSPATTLITVQK
jgi:uncharacterized protein (TIGR03437 family)